jgi:nucleoside-diphosphate-sugar epimerase
VPEIVRQLREGSGIVRLGNLTPRRDYTDVVDVAAALHSLVDSQGDGPTVFNLGSGRSTSVTDVIRACEAVLGRAIDVDVESARTRVQDRAELVADARRLREATGWEPTRSLHETLRELLSDSSAP